MDEQQALAEPYVVTWGERRIKFGPVNQGMKAELVAAAKLTAIREFNEYLDLRYPDKTTESMAERREAMERFEGKICTAQYKWGGSLQEEWRAGPDGMPKFITALLKAGGNELSDDEIEDMLRAVRDEVSAAIMLCTMDLNNPKAKRPGETASQRMAALLGQIRLKKSTEHSSTNHIGSASTKSAA